jgi:DNA-binding FadR family transcriptional regulator
MSIARATDNPYFVDLLSTLSLLPPDKPPRAYANGSARKLHLLQLRMEHEQIVRAIERRDADAARAAMRLHLANSLERTAAIFDNSESSAAADD